MSGGKVMSPKPIRKFQQAFLRSWLEAEATVEACSWVHDHDYTGVNAGHYDVAISYPLADPDTVNAPVNPTEKLHRGQFCHSGSRQIAPYHPGEQIAIRYNSKNPSHFHLTNASPNYEKLETILVMTLFALIAGYLLFTV